MAAIPTLELHGLIATGEFSAVFLATKTVAHAPTSLTAVKCFARSTLRMSTCKARQALREKRALALLGQLPHPFIVQFRYAHIDQARCYLGMEYVGGGDFYMLLQTKGALPPDAVRIYAGEIALGLAHVHSFDVIYRDLKPENILIGLDGHIKLSDFGAALKMLGRDGETPPPAHACSLRGTPEYIAPELLLSMPTCETSDWWAFGCVVCELLTGDSPFFRDEQSLPNLVSRILHESISVPSHPNVTADASELMEALLVRNPEQRLGCRPHGSTLVLEHPFFHSDVTVEGLLSKAYGAPWVPLLGAAGAAQGMGGHAAVDAHVENHAMGWTVEDAEPEPMPATFNGFFASWGDSIQLVTDDIDAEIAPDDDVDALLDAALDDDDVMPQPQLAAAIAALPQPAAGPPDVDNEPGVPSAPPTPPMSESPEGSLASAESTAAMNDVEEFASVMGLVQESFPGDLPSEPTISPPSVTASLAEMRPLPSVEENLQISSMFHRPDKPSSSGDALSSFDSLSSSSHRR